ncbi:hypothetical protein CLIM01_12827 [Colletotrichum limetticola]|uniref:Uncharacterized protein n=1 Tax=Colletotrichum limetticola TaxID=1209924 RepID=A0ABQ9PCK0_9PEZI|nr:hypothetical protein CLIM01_12827 [Colletotrichum limetticola]
MAQLDYNNYKVAWIAPLEIEAQAAMYMLDDVHTGRFPVREGQDYPFIAGCMCGHNVVIASFASGQEYGTEQAASLAGQLKILFPRLWFTLLVGVAAGLPSPQRDIRLGDVLVAHSDGEVPAIVAYHLGKETSEGLKLLHDGRSQLPTNPVVTSAFSKIKIPDPMCYINRFLDHFNAMQYKEHTKGNFKDPGQSQDKLNETTSSGEKAAVLRELRPDNRRTRVWYGPIGSGDKLMKNAKERDVLRDKYSIIGLEMEAAGVMNRLNVGVIRGVCDYGDEQKNKEWQPYAAAMAAAYAKQVLLEISVVPSDAGLHIRTPEEARYNEQPGSLSSKTHARMREPAVRKPGLPPSPASSDIEMDSDHQTDVGTRLRARATDIVWPEIRNERPALASKFVKRKKFPECLQANSPLWNAEERQSPMKLLVHGVTGVGKSQICLQAIAENESRFRAVFYVDASSRKSANSSYLAIAGVSGTLIDTSGISSDENISQQISRTRFWMSNLEEPWILFIDNAEPSVAADLDDYLPRQGCGIIIITTIDGQVASSCDIHENVRPMDSWDANELIHNFVDATKDFSEDEWEAIETLASETLGGLPLAIVQAGSYIANNPNSLVDYCYDFRQAFQTNLGELPDLSSGSGQSKSASHALGVTMALVENSPETIELLRTLCFFHNENISEQIFEEAWNNLTIASPGESSQWAHWAPLVPLLDPTSAQWRTPSLRKAFNTLCRYSLLVCDASYSSKYSMNKLVQTNCRESLSIEDQNKYAYQAACLSALALANEPVSTTASRMDNPSGVDLQKAMIPHIESFTSNGLMGNWVELAEIERRLEIMLILANTYSSTGHFRDAGDILKEAIEICKDPSVPNSLTLQVNEQVADCYFHTGHHVEALRYQPGVVQAYQQWGAGFDYLWSAQINHADSLWSTGQRSEALAMAEAALATCGSHDLPADDPKMVRTRLLVADFLHGSGGQRRALELRQETVRDLQRRVSVISGERLRILEAKSALGDSYDWDGQLLKSMSLRKKVHKAMLELLGVDHPDTLHAFDRLADTRSLVAHTQEEKEEVCRLREEAVTSWRRVRGEGHPQTNEARVNLGHSYTAASRFEEALAEQEDVLAMRNEKVFNDAVATDVYLVSVGNVADALWRVGDIQEAYSRLEDGLEEAKVMEDLDAIFSIRSYASTFLSRQGREDSILKAINLRQDLLKDQEGAFGEGDVRTHQAQLLLAMDLAKLGMFPQAIQVHEKLLQRQSEDPGEESQGTLDNKKALASVLSAVNAAPQAAVLMNEVMQVETKHLGRDHPRTRETGALLHRYYQEAGDAQAAFQVVTWLNTQPIGNGEHHEDSDSDDEEEDNVPRVGSAHRDLTPVTSPARPLPRQIQR